MNKTDRIFKEFDREKMTVNWLQAFIMRLQPWKWKYLPRLGVFIKK